LVAGRGRFSSVKNKLREEVTLLEKDAAINQEKIASFQGESQKLNQDLTTERQLKDELSINYARLGADFNNLQQKLNEQKNEIEELQKKFTAEFENIAIKILKENSREFTSLNQKNISDILNPLKEKIEKI